jgi:hypothetical protein
MVNAEERQDAKEGLDAESLEAARLAIREGLREGLEPFAQLAAEFEKTMRKVSETMVRIRDHRVG